MDRLPNRPDPRLVRYVDHEGWTRGESVFVRAIFGFVGALWVTALVYVLA